MYILRREVLSQKLAILVWSLAIGGMVAVCVLIYPEMAKQMDNLTDMMSSMGGFTKAFGMDQLNFGSLGGYYAIECGNMLGIGGSFFAAIIGISALMKEERDRTAEFLLTHPLSRARVVTEKLLSVLAIVLILNVIVFALSAGSILIIGEEVSWSSVLLLHLAYLLMQLEVAAICFGISAFIAKFGIGIGIGIAAVFYFMNILSNITGDAKFLKYITPFGYTDPTAIVNNNSIEMKYLLPGFGFLAIGIVVAYFKYLRKDIRS